MGSSSESERGPGVPRVVRARPSGFCFGVERALELVEGHLAEGRPLCALGPLIHNDRVVRDLTERGVRPVDRVADVQPHETLVIRTHGVPAEILREAQERGIVVTDATCPFVGRVHEHARRLAAEGRHVCIVGDREHPEVLGIIGSVDAACHVLETAEQARALPSLPRIGVVAQTTQSSQNYCEIVGILAGRCSELVAHNTLCNATHERQLAALELAERADVMLVVGGRQSANTLRLAELCAATGTPTHHVEKAEELRPEWFDGVALVGVTAGASTPNSHITEVESRAMALVRPQGA